MCKLNAMWEEPGRGRGGATMDLELTSYYSDTPPNAFIYPRCKMFFCMIC